VSGEIEPNPVRTMPVLLGFCIGNGASYAALYISGLVFLWVLVAQGVPPEEVYARAYQSTPYLVYAHILGFLAMAPGGYWTARLSSGSPVRRTLFAGALMSSFVVAQLAIPYDLPIPWWSQVASVVTPIPAFIAGMLWWKHRA
jgi:hypothetical protein